MPEKKSLNVEIGNRIQYSREQLHMTQEQLAEEIGRSTQFISTIERGIAGPSLETIIRLCEVLKVSADWLLRGHETTAQATAGELVMKLSLLSQSQLTIVARIVNDLVLLTTLSREPQENA